MRLFVEQLKMRWKNDSIPAALTLPAGCAVSRFTETADALDEWLDIVSYGLTNGKMDADFYRETMTDRKNYTPEKCFFILCGGKPSATVTVICDGEKKEGYVHMVACREDCRGKGIGTALINLAVKVLKDEGMESAYLTTDDWRIPAIKSYLRAGFVPEYETDSPEGASFEERWKKIFEEIGR